MPRRLKLSPLQTEIIWCLEEAGAETIGTVMATVKVPDKNEFESHLEGLIRLGLIQKREPGDRTRNPAIMLVLTDKDRAALRS